MFATKSLVKYVKLVLFMEHKYILNEIIVDEETIRVFNASITKSITLNRNVIRQSF